MTTEIISASLINQISGQTPFFFERLNAILKMPKLQRFRAVVAYARWSGIGLIAPSLEGFLQAGGEFQSIFGVANGVTTPDSLLYSLYLQNLYSTYTYAGAVEDEYENATFHPKFFEFTFPDKTIAIIGSANLTGAGLSRNIEVSAEIEVEHGTQFEKHLEISWNSIHPFSHKLTYDLVRAIKSKDNLASEEQKKEGHKDKETKSLLKVGVITGPKPLFKKILDTAPPAKKASVLSKLDSLTEQPRKLYLQILKGETGAQTIGGTGYQIQLPVATLATFFGVGTQQDKQVAFWFGDEQISVHLTHFNNNTHRIRLRPLRDVVRPAIVVFHRIGSNEYKCSIVPAKDYNTVLATKCTEQTRVGARRWGIE